MIVYGTVLAYPTKTLPGLRNETDTSIQLDEHMGSWYAALFWICGIICAPLGGSLSGWLGRRKTILINLPLVFTGWLITALASDRTMLFLGRGLAASAILSYAPSIGVYISETVHPELRPSLIILPSCLLAIGYLPAWILGIFFSLEANRS